MRPLLVLPLLLLISIAATSTFSRAGASHVVRREKEEPTPGGWTPIKNVSSDPHVGKIAEFAVEEQNKQPNATQLTLGEVVWGETQVVEGIKYRLVLTATGGGGGGKGSEALYVAEVLEMFMKLLSFDLLLD